VSGRVGEDAARFVSVLEDGDVVLTNVELETHFLSGETTVAGIENRALNVRVGKDELPVFALMDPLQEWVYLVAESGDAVTLRRQGGTFVINERLRPPGNPERVTAFRFLTGCILLPAG